MALLPPFFLDTVVAIGKGDDPKKRRWIGTGFLYGDRVQHTDNREKNGHIWLITNKHVLKESEKIYIKFNSATAPDSKDYPVRLVVDGRPQWIGHQDDDTDVAAMLIDPGVLDSEDRKYQIVLSDKHVMDKQAMANQGVTEGDRVFVLGFPMGLVAPERQYVICRGGVFGRLRDYLDNSRKDYLVDVPVFPGNSGGPVITCPSAIAIEGTKSVVKADLVGVVKGYIPYEDVAISMQTGKPRVVFQENSGLTAVEGTQAVIETVDLAEKRRRARLAGDDGATQAEETDELKSTVREKPDPSAKS